MIEEKVTARLLLSNTSRLGAAAVGKFGLGWLDKLQLSFCKGLVVDRQLVFDVDARVSVDAGRGGWYKNATGHEDDAPLDFREVPVALLRRYFSDTCNFERLVRPRNVWVGKEIRFAKRRHAVLLLDMCFCSFERSLQMMAELLATGSHEKRRALTFDVFKHVSSDADFYWKGFPLPESVDGLLSTEPDAELSEWILKNRLLLWTTCVWRMHVARKLAICSKVCNERKEHKWLAYKLVLFADTHLDLLSLMMKSNTYDDAKLAPSAYNAKSPLERFYPSSICVCCAEELPNFVGLLPYSNIQYDTGVKKGKDTLTQAIVHLLQCKEMNHICQIRALHKQLPRLAKTHPVLLSIFKAVVRCVLFGNLPEARNQLNVVAKIKVNSEFQFGTNGLPDELVVDWLKNTRHFALFLLREFHFHTCKSGGVVNRVLKSNTKWRRFKSLVRGANAACRNEISKQMAADASKPVDWARLFHEEVLPKKSKNAPPQTKKSGIVMHYHNLSLDTNVKLKKDLFEKILLKKMTAVESELEFYTNKFEWPDVSLETFKFVAWCSARSRRHVLPTACLQWLGMTASGFATVREWVFEYYVYDSSDDGHKIKTKRLFEESPSNYFILKLYLKLLMHYREDNFFYLPVQHVLRQYSALRSNLLVEAWMPTPELAGHVYFCEGCGRWANPVVSEVDWSTEKKTLEKSLAVSYSTFLSAAYFNPTTGKLHCARKRKCTDSEETRCEKDESTDENESSGNSDQEWGCDIDAELADASSKSGRSSTSILRAQLQWAQARVDDLMTMGEDEANGKNDCLDAGTSNDANDPKHKTKMTTLINSALADCFSCVKDPLVDVDFVGLFKLHNGRVYGLCCLCGCLVQVKNENVTNLGVTCGRHVTSETRPTHPIWPHFLSTNKFLSRNRRSAAALASAYGNETDNYLMPCLFGCATQAIKKHVQIYGPNFYIYSAWMCTQHHRMYKQMLGRINLLPRERVLSQI